MLGPATDWATISSLATAVGTLVLAIATFVSVRSANRSARIAEQALLEQRRPVLTTSRLEDPTQKIMFVDKHWVRAEGSRGVAEYVGGNVYLALSLRNAGTGIGVCQGWAVRGRLATTATAPTHIPESEFRAQTRDLYIAAGDIGLWQGAIRSPQDPAYAELVEAIENRQPISIELLYTDQVGGQRTISRFGLTPWPDDSWFAAITRHWHLDRPGPRDEGAAVARVEQILREQAARAEATAEEGYSSASEDPSVPSAPASG